MSIEISYWYYQNGDFRPAIPLSTNALEHELNHIFPEQLVETHPHKTVLLAIKEAIYENCQNKPEEKLLQIAVLMIKKALNIQWDEYLYNSPLFTTPRILKDLWKKTKVQCFRNKETYTTDLFYLDKTDSGNWCIRAKVDIKPETVIAICKPISTIEFLTRELPEFAFRWIIWAQKLTEDPIYKKIKHIVDDLYPRNDTTSAVYTNLTHKLSLSCFGKSSHKIHLYNTFSFLNHACVPNSIYDIDDSGKITIKNCIAIPSHAEITICYQDDILFGDDPDRRANLLLSKAIAHSKCNCTACENPTSMQPTEFLRTM